MNRLSSKAMVLLVFVAASAYSYPGETVIEELRGARAFAEGDYEKALNHFEKVLERDPASVRAKYNQGVTWLKIGDREKAKEIFRGVFDPTQRDLTSKALYNRLLLDHEDARQALTPLNELLPAPEQVPLDQVEKVKQKAQEALQRYEKLLAQYREFAKYGLSDPRYGRNLEIAARERDALEDFIRRLPEPPSQPQPESTQDQKQQQEQNENQEQQSEQSPQNQQQKTDEQSQDQQQQQEQNNQQSEQQPQDEQKQQQGEQQQEADQKRDQDQRKSPADQNEQQESEQMKEEPQKESLSLEKQGQEERDRQKKGTLKPSSDEKKDSGTQAEPVRIGEMSADEARRLLNSLPEEDKRALLRLIRRGQQQEEQSEERDW